MSSRCMMGPRRRRRFFPSRLFHPRHGRSRCVNHQGDRLNRRRVISPPLLRCPHVSREFITIRRLHRRVEGVYKSPLRLLRSASCTDRRGIFHDMFRCTFRITAGGGKMRWQHEREALIKLLISCERSDLRKPESASPLWKL